MIEKTTRAIILFDFYQELFTDKQREYFHCYYEDDLSLGEISEKLGVSRNAAHDNLKRTVKQIEEYEVKLKLYSKYLLKQELIEEYKKTKENDLLDRIADL